MRRDGLEEEEKNDFKFAFISKLVMVDKLSDTNEMCQVGSGAIKVLF